MHQRWSTCFGGLALLFGLSFGHCFAQPALDAGTVLQICEAFSNKAPDQVPAIVLPEAARNFFEKYSRWSEQLHGCLSATEAERQPDRATFLLQNTRYESYWRFSLDDTSITAVAIDRFRPVTLAGDEDWQATSAVVPHVYLRKPGIVVEPAADEPNIVEFFYATNRKESDEPVYPKGNPDALPVSASTYSSNGWTAVSDYTGERDADLSFGAIRVRVPQGHQMGKLELPPEFKIFSLSFFFGGDPTNYFTLRSIEKTDEDTWIKSLSAMKGNKALVFVHGFNTKFRDAAFRTAQIVWDLQFRGTTVLFSWPSRGEIADYLYDKDSALGSREALLHVIADLHKAGFDDINIIAHSMGNLIAVDALSNSAATQSPAAIAQFVMAAPDVDRDMFIQEIPRVATVAKGLTLYASANDKALQLSERVAGNIPRAGDVPASGPVVVPPLATIDVSAIGDEMFGLNHDTFATTKNVLNDLKILLETGAPPPRLAEIRGYPEPPQAARYFRYVP